MSLVPQYLFSCSLKAKNMAVVYALKNNIWWNLKIRNLHQSSIAIKRKLDGRWWNLTCFQNLSYGTECARSAITVTSFALIFRIGRIVYSCNWLDCVQLRLLSENVKLMYKQFCILLILSCIYLLLDYLRIVAFIFCAFKNWGGGVFSTISTPWSHHYLP